jgi:hypothetical protein
MTSISPATAVTPATTRPAAISQIENVSHRIAAVRQ